MFRSELRDRDGHPAPARRRNMVIQPAQKFPEQKTVRPALCSGEDQYVRMIHLNQKCDSECIVIRRQAQQFPCFGIAGSGKPVQLGCIRGCRIRMKFPYDRRKGIPPGKCFYASAVSADAGAVDSRQVKVSNVAGRTVRTVRQERMIGNDRRSDADADSDGDQVAGSCVAAEMIFRPCRGGL